MFLKALRGSAFAGASLFLLYSCATTETVVREPIEVDLEASAKNMERHMTFLADDALKGREAGTEGYDVAADYVAKEFQKLGLKPGGDKGSWYQQVTLRTSKRDFDKANMTLTINGETTEISSLDDYIVGLPANGKDTEVSGELVFAGYGIESEELGINDYEGLDVDGKIVVLLAGRTFDAPAEGQEISSEIQAHLRSRRTQPEIAQAKGAKGIIYVYDHSTSSRFPWERVQEFAKRATGGWATPEGDTFSSSPKVAITASLSPDLSEKLFDSSKMSYADILEMTEKREFRPEGFALNASATIKGGAIVEDVQSPNVIGILPGTDSKLKDEYVILTAHLDHTGHRESDDPEADTINNGALDNSSGIATLLEEARFLTEGPAPRRSIVFAAVTAEEKGLIGSEFFAQYPTVPQDKMVANVNLDMPLILYPFTDVIAFGADRSTLGGMVREAAASMDVELAEDPVPNMSLFIRSDHYRFVQQGVPSVFLFLGFANGGEEIFNKFMSTNYHRPSDDLSQEIDFFQGARFAKLNYLISFTVANEDERPTWNEGDFFGELYTK